MSEGEVLFKVVFKYLDSALTRDTWQKIDTRIPLGGVAVVEWLHSRPLDCEVRDSNTGQGRNLKTKISASGAPQRW